MRTAVEYLVEEFDLEMQDTFHLEKITKAKEMENNRAQEYAEFAIRCDRMGMKILNFEDWIKL